MILNHSQHCQNVIVTVQMPLLHYVHYMSREGDETARMQGDCGWSTTAIFIAIFIEHDRTYNGAADCCGPILSTAFANCIVRGRINDVVVDLTIWVLHACYIASVCVTRADKVQDSLWVVVQECRSGHHERGRGGEGAVDCDGHARSRRHQTHVSWQRQWLRHTPLQDSGAHLSTLLAVSRLATLTDMPSMSPAHTYPTS